MKSIDINCDLGEGFNNEDLLMPFLSSCNIACGGHAGDLETMNRVAQLAKAYNVKIGAHPSFPDKKHFGRQVVDMTTSELYQALTEQITAFAEVLIGLDLGLHHIKPHGALYNLVAVDEDSAQVLVDVVKNIDKNLILYAPDQSVISKIASEEGLKIMYEGFADRNYNDNLTLVSRKDAAAIIHDSVQIFKHVFNMISEGKVITKNGVEVALKVDTFCVHGDHEDVIENLKFLTKKLNQNSIQIL